ncbi:ATPase family protein associated with various cellular activities (AAA) [Microbacterium sp. SLBN-154]|uniref:NACHT domain-containing protein n=1 Tax=Microbacterium sp. SLBN-154 TaxID=2768458 RepID=UPI0011536660|nr:AAA family ATPase [Microbacterium sp. SLBN-154]TQK17755.1 ATPase family protein associated with various cellular activities (AAA) [Microbacterium sp. SLBN-154]
MDYSFASLGSDGFEQMAQALAIAELGNNVRPLGRGRDKGRDAYFRGEVQHPASNGAGNWNGYGVIQAKHLARDVDTTANTAWVKKHIASELKKWLPGENGESPERDDPPQFYLLMTNATLSPEGYDACVEELRSYAGKLRMKDVDLWSASGISRLLDDHVGVRQTYLHFVVPGDVIAALMSAYSVEEYHDLGRWISANTAVELGDRQWTRLGESGLESDERLRLANVAIDVPSLIVDPEVERDVWASAASVAHVVERASALARRSSEPTFRGSLIIGGPGQGKSTIAQLICQLHRAALLDGNAALMTDQQKLVTEIKAAASRVGFSLPDYRRWPAYIELSQFGDEIAKDESLSILRYIASRVRVQGERLTTAQLLRWRRMWPWIVVLDGLDEVAHPRTREHVVRAVNEFLTDCNVADADVFIVATTRPQGYHGELDGFELEQLELQPLSISEALSYGTKLADARHAQDAIARERVLERLAQAATSDTTQRLMTTPLQVTIMSTLLERLTRVPDTRHALFDEYYSAIYARETGKAGFLGDILARFKHVIDYVHEQVALYLHVQAERPGSAEALLLEADLEMLIFERLEQDEHEQHEARRLVAELIRAVRNRVVLLVGLRGDLVGFEVRSIQEYLAARAITSGAEETVLDRLELLIPSSHWRNTWLLAAGRLQGHSNPQLVDALLTRLEKADLASALSIEIGPGQRLALDLLEDQFAAAIPRIRRLLLRRALGVLDHWGDQSIRKLSQTGAIEVGSGKEAFELVRTAVRRGLQSTGPARSTTVALLLSWQRATAAAGTLANSELAQARGWRPTRDVRRPKRRIDLVIAAVGDFAGIDVDVRESVERALRSLSRVSVLLELTAAEVATQARRNDLQLLPRVTRAFQDPAVRDWMIDASTRLTESEGAAAVYIRQYLLSAAESEPVGWHPLISQPGVGLFPSS